MMNRRTFVGTLAVVSAAGGLGLGGVLAQRRHLTMADIGPAALRSLRGRSVSLRSPDGSRLGAVVAEVTAVRRPRRGDAPATEQVSLLLAAGETPAGVYRLENEDLRLGELHFSPVGRAGSDRRLEAVITRIV